MKALSAAELKTSPVCNVGATYACVLLQNNPSAASELRSFFASSASHHASQTGMQTYNTFHGNPVHCNVMNRTKTSSCCDSDLYSSGAEDNSHFLTSALYTINVTFLRSVFSSVSTPIARLKASAGALLFDLCTAAPDKMVSDLRMDEVWCYGASVYVQSSSINRDREGEASHLSLCDNLLPLPAFTQVGTLNYNMLCTETHNIRILIVCHNANLLTS